METDTTARRPLKSRQARWAHGAAAWLARAGITPNAISFCSILFAALAGVALYETAGAAPAARVWLLVGAAAAIQLRLICNRMDGMVAIEGGKKTKSGEVFNDLPDRIADPLVLIPAGYAATALTWGPELGWLAALLAVMTAYVRVLGGSTGVPQSFMGPMAKQHRMAVMTLACLLSAAEGYFGWRGTVLAIALAVIVLGSAVTVLRRAVHLVRALEAR